MLLDDAILHADDILKVLGPHCDRIEVAGSIRRKKPNPNDIEIVCIPKRMDNWNAKTKEYTPSMGFIQEVLQWKKVRGEPWDKYTQRIKQINPDTHPLRPLTDGSVIIDIFTCTAENWGYIMAIRTGSATYSHERLAKTWVKKGYKGKEGYLYKGNTMVPVREEKELFMLLDIPYVEPENRNL